MESPEGRKVDILVLGAGFGGLYAALYLQEEFRHERDVEVVLIDQNNYHTFTPLLPEVAAGAILSQHVTYPLRQLGFRFIQGVVKGIDLQAKRVVLETIELRYDYLVIALGSVSDYFGMEEVRRNSLVLKSLWDALVIKNHILKVFEAAAIEGDEERKRALLTFVVAGAGPGGVEVVSEIRHYITDTLARYYPRIDVGQVRTILVHAGDRVLPHLTPDLSQAALEELGRMGIEIRLKTRVTGAADGQVFLDGKETVQAKTIVWTTGIRAHPVTEEMPVEKDKNGRIKVDEHLEVPGFPGVYAIGDIACAMDPRTKRSFPPVAPVAIREGVMAAVNIINDYRGRPKEPFRYDYIGDMVSLGSNSAIVIFLGLKIKGRLGWWFYRATFLLKLFGFRNKVLLLIHWIEGLFFERDICLVEG